MRKKAVLHLDQYDGWLWYLAILGRPRLTVTPDNGHHYVQQSSAKRAGYKVAKFLGLVIIKVVV